MSNEEKQAVIRETLEMVKTDMIFAMKNLPRSLVTPTQAMRGILAYLDAEIKTAAAKS